MTLFYPKSYVECRDSISDCQINDENSKAALGMNLVEIRLLCCFKSNFDVFHSHAPAGWLRVEILVINSDA